MGDSSSRDWVGLEKAGGKWWGFFHFGFILLVTVHIKLSAFPFYHLCHKHSSYLWLWRIGTIQIKFFSS